jgi:hypothetical protein
MDVQDDVEFLSFLLTKTQLQKEWYWAHGGAVSDNGTLFVCHSQLGPEPGDSTQTYAGTSHTIHKITSRVAP